MSCAVLEVESTHAKAEIGEGFLRIATRRPSFTPIHNGIATGASSRLQNEHRKLHLYRAFSQSQGDLKEIRDNFVVHLEPGTVRVSIVPRKTETDLHESETAVAFITLFGGLYTFARIGSLFPLEGADFEEAFPELTARGRPSDADNQVRYEAEEDDSPLNAGYGAADTAMEHAAGRRPPSGGVEPGGSRVGCLRLS